MKKINVIILFFAVLFLFFSCSESSENLYSKSKGPKEEAIIVDLRKDVAYSKEFITPGSYTWTVPDNIKGNMAVTIVAGGGGGGGYSPMMSSAGGGGGAGQRFVDLYFIVTAGETIIIEVGGGGNRATIYGQMGGNGENSSIITAHGSFVALAGNGGNLYDNGYEGGSGWPSGQDGGHFYIGGNGGDNGGGYGKGSEFDAGTSAPANSGGGGGGSGGGRGYDMFPAGNGGSGYVRIDYIVHE